MSKKRRSGRTLKRPESLRLLLLTGIPATGKTRIGDHLRDQHGFRHLDFEQMPTLQRYLNRDEPGLRQRIEALRKSGRDVVVTWGFVPDTQLRFVLLLRSLGFKWVWFDGDRHSALREYLNRGSEQQDWDRQLAKIEVHIDPHIDSLAPAVVNTFDDMGRFRQRDEIASQLIG